MPQQDHLFTSESVSMGHPDKVCDQISDALLDSLIKHDPLARTAIETLVTTGLVVVAGEVPATHRMEADLAVGPDAGMARAAVLGHVVEVHPEAARRGLAEGQGGAAGRILFHAVMPLHDLYVVPLAFQGSRGGLHQGE